MDSRDCKKDFSFILSNFLRKMNRYAVIKTEVVQLYQDEQVHHHCSDTCMDFNLKSVEGAGRKAWGVKEGVENDSDKSTTEKLYF